jgi:hypothetical protein
MNPPFIVFSFARSGSTTIQRALNLFPGVRVAFEPGFEEVVFSPESVRRRVKEILGEYTGFKHVFDPAGCPFVSENGSTEALEMYAGLWMELTQAILNYPGVRIVFLRRRDEFERTVSELVGRATQLYMIQCGAVRPDESERYRSAVQQVPLPELDRENVRWYVENMPRMADFLLDSIRTNPVMEVCYEDLFGSSVPLSERVRQFTDILNFLAIAPDREVLDSAALSMLFSPAAKLNRPEVFARVPNYGALRATLGNAASPARGKAAAWLGKPYRKNWMESDEQLTSRIRTERETPSASRPEWQLLLQPGNVAAIGRPGEAPGQLRVSLTRTSGWSTYSIQLNTRIGAVDSSAKYTIRFRCRADQPRTIGVGVAKACENWANLGWYEQIELGREWLEFRREFSVQSHANARVHLDLAGNDAAVEIADYSLTCDAGHEREGEVAAASERVLQSV